MVLCVDDGQTSMYAVLYIEYFFSWPFEMTKTPKLNMTCIRTYLVVPAHVEIMKWALGSHTMVKENIPLKGSTLMQILHCFEFLLS